jgi:hypothetical protein
MRRLAGHATCRTRLIQLLSPSCEAKEAAILHVVLSEKARFRHNLLVLSLYSDDRSVSVYSIVAGLEEEPG